MTMQARQDVQGYYQILDLPAGASQAEIERQYRRLSRLYAPEKLDDPEDRAYAEAKLAEIEEAYTALSEQPLQEPTAPGDGVEAEEVVLYCANHPDRETLLRCNKCNKPICMDCAVQTPVGYRCRECVYEQQNVYFTAASTDNFIAFGVGFLVAAIAAPIVGVMIGSLGFWGFIIAFIAGSGAGSLLAQIIRRSVGGRRGRRLPLFALSGIVLGVLAGNLAIALVLQISPIAFLFNLPMLLFTGLALASAYPQLR